MKPFITLLLASIALLFANTQVNACDLDPTAEIDLNSSSDGIFYHGETIILDGQSSSANCGYITEYTWYIDLGPFNQTVSTSVDYLPDSSLNQGQDSRELDIILRVKNSVGNYDYASITISIVRKPSSYYYLRDHLGSVRVTVDSSGTAVGWDDYYPFGLQMPGRTQNANNPDEDIKFTGYELEQQCETDSSGGCINDVVLGLYHAEARMYDPVIGRFNQIDPYAAEYTSLSPYVYVANNPINAIDPDGRRIFFVGGANNDQDGWNYINRWGRAFTNAGVQGFTRVNASGGRAGDIAFTSMYRHSRYETYSRGVNTDTYIAGLNPAPNYGTRPVQHRQINSALNQVQNSLADSPLAKGEQLNLAGYSYGSVLQAHVALNLAESGTRVDNLILIGSPISSDSDLFSSLSTHGNIGNVIRFDISGDLLSNPNNLEYLKGAFQNLGDDGAHFDLARPGKDVDQLIMQVVNWLKEKGVK